MSSGGDAMWAASMPEAYDRWLEPVMFHPFAVDLARRAAALNPLRVLELAAGTGALTKELLSAVPDATVTATDLNPPMVELGSARAPGAHWRQADALDLPFDDDEFDLVACQFGVMFFPDKVAGFAEARRVLKPDGHLLFNVWDTVNKSFFAAALVAALERIFPDDPPTFLTAVPHGYADLDVVEADLTAAGMRLVAAETLVLEATAESTAGIVKGFCTGSPLRFFLESRGDLEEMTSLVAQELTAVLGAGPVSGELTAHVIHAAPAAI